MDDGVKREYPFLYLFERLARRWGVAPYELERELDDPAVQLWLYRGLLFMKLEAVEVRNQP